MSKICSIDGCGKPHFGHGWCSAHYHRWRRHGGPTAGGTSPGAAQSFFRDVVATYDGHECLTWPFADVGNGYGALKFDGRMQLVHRIACELQNGPPPAVAHEAAHSCGNGARGCCTKRHLVWKTHKENEADKIIHGTTNRGENNGYSKLTEQEAREILALKGQMSQQKIGSMFGVDGETVRSIHIGRTWAWL